MFDGKQIRDKRRALGLSVEKLASMLGVSKDNLFKWEKGHRPREQQDYIKMESWLGGKLETIPTVKPAQNGGNSELMDMMKERINELKEDKAFLKRNLEFSLAGLAVGQKSILAHVSTILEKDNERDADGNKKKEQLLKDDTDRRIADRLSGSSQMDTFQNR